jgi:N-acetylmuramoyl-L-alanine amidase
MNIIKTNFKYTKPLIPLNLDKVLFIVIHHPDAKTATPEQIHQWHLERGFNGFGYNEYIRKDGTVYIGRGDNIGAQCKNMNSKSYGICCEGDYEVEKDMPKAQFDALVERLKYHKARFKNLVGIEPHNKFNPTSCPGKYFPFQQMINALEEVKTEEDLVNSAIDKLARIGIITSPTYWKNRAKEGEIAPGEWVAILIRKMADYIE